MSTNLPASVMARLKALAKENGWEYPQVLARYATERFLARLAASRFADRFVLKGGNLFVVWLGGYGYRPTMDTDFLYCGRADEAALDAAFREIAAAPSPDGDDAVVFDLATLRVAPIRVQTRYGGNEVALLARLGKARIQLRFDIGFGDRVWPAVRTEPFPALLAGPPPQIRTYPKEASIAEKLHAMLEHGFENSRMKDFHDVWFLASRYGFRYADLAEAVRRTLADRKAELTAVPPVAFTDDFANHPLKLSQWSGFVQRTRLRDSAPPFPEAVATIRAFLLPVLYPPTPVPKDWMPENGWIP